MDREIIESLAARYPQLLLPLSFETKNSERYRAAVLRGEPVEGTPEFLTSESDTLEVYATPAGEVPVLYLENREDFEHALRALAYRCEPREILPSVGASTVSGLINWERIRSHKREFLASGGWNWAAEFKRFTAEKENYQDTLILLSAGYYSAVPPESLGLAPELWLEKSLVIRKYHELTHFVCRKLFPERKNVLRDEIYADCIGLTAAFGSYHPNWARMFLGIENESYRPGGRLEHYFDTANLPRMIPEAERYIEEAAQRAASVPGSNVFALLQKIYPQS